MIDMMDFNKTELKGKEDQEQEYHTNDADTKGDEYHTQKLDNSPELKPTGSKALVLNVVEAGDNEGGVIVTKAQNNLIDKKLSIATESKAKQRKDDKV